MKEMSKEYAVAVFTLGKESGREVLFEDSMRKALAILRDHPEYEAFLKCPGIPMEARLSGIRETFSGEACEEVIALLELLCRRGRLAILEDCLKEYQELLRIFQNKAVAKVTSAVALTKEEQTRLQERLAQQSKQSVLLSCSVDPSLIGGIIVEMNGGVMDGSLRTRLEQVKEVVNQ